MFLFVFFLITDTVHSHGFTAVINAMQWVYTFECVALGSVWLVYPITLRKYKIFSERSSIQLGLCWGIALTLERTSNPLSFICRC